MPSYESIAQFYDAVNGEPVELCAQILGLLESHSPSASSVLELGCGTGLVLAGLGSGFALTGVDLSKEMLDIARRRCPSVTLVEGDFTSLDLVSTFDVVLSVFDTMNHLTSREKWRAAISVAAKHLVPSGLFIFDVNTIERLGSLSEVDPWAYDFDGHTLVMSVESTSDNHAIWHLKVFEPQINGTYRCHEEAIEELALSLSEVRELLSQHFEVLEVLDTNGATATEESERAIFVARRR